MLYALWEFLSVYVHTQSIKIGLEDESKSFFYVFNEIVVYVSWYHLLSSVDQLLHWRKKARNHTQFFFQCVHIAKEATKLPAGEANQKERKMCEN